MTHGSPTDLPPLREVISRHGLSARRGLGQHFLLDLNLTRRIARTPGDLSGRTVIEIGPGPGGLTRALLETDAAQVVAVERDKRCIGALADLMTAYPDRLKVIEADALDQDLADLGPPPRQIVANLPYNIATQLLLNWLQQPGDVEKMTLMFQTEVAQRLTANPHEKAYGRLSVLTQWLCDASHLFDISARAFTPPPKVTSSVVRLVTLSKPRYPASRPMLERVTAAAFGQRRKMLRSSLRQLGDVEQITKRAGIDATQRAENLSVADFCRLAEAVATAAPATV